MSNLIYVGKSPTDDAIFFENLKYAQSTGITEYFQISVDQIPKGNSRILTDGISRVWLDTTPPPVIPEIPETKIETPISLEQLRADIDFLAVLSGVEL